MRILFIIQLIVAVVMGLMGILVEVRPYALVEVVLTPDQLKDRSTMDETLALLQKATGYDSAWWLILGGIVFGIAITGLVLRDATPKQKSLPST